MNYHELLDGYYFVESPKFEETTAMPVQTNKETADMGRKKEMENELNGIEKRIEECKDRLRSLEDDIGKKLAEVAQMAVNNDLISESDDPLINELHNALTNYRSKSLTSGTMNSNLYESQITKFKLIYLDKKRSIMPVTVKTNNQRSIWPAQQGEKR